MFNSTREFEARVLVRGKPVTEVVHQGNTYIEGRRKSTYELQFLNKTSQPVLVVPSVDGLSVIDGQPAGKESSGFVVEPYGEVTIPGWTVNNREAAEFIFHAQGAYYDDEQTYAEETGQDPRNQGVIGFMVFRQDWTKLYNIPKTSRPIKRGGPWGGGPEVRRASHSWKPGGHPESFTSDVYNITAQSFSSVVGSTSGEGSSVNCSFTPTMDTFGNTPSYGVDVDAGKPLGTGFGEAVEFGTQSVEFHREANPCATFVFYYDTKQNLRKIGVPVEEFRRHYTESYDSGPQAFPESPEVTGYAKPPRGWTGRAGSSRSRNRKTRR